jgi:transposase
MDETSGLKRGEAGTFWKEAVRLWTESGFSVREFCRREGLAEHSFYAWRRKLRPETASIDTQQRPLAADGGEMLSKDRLSAVEFIPVRVLAEEVATADPMSDKVAAGPSPIEIDQGFAWRVRVSIGFDPATLDAVLTVLERRPC